MTLANSPEHQRKQLKIVLEPSHLEFAKVERLTQKKEALKDTGFFSVDSLFFTSFKY
jgi:hypothetical protein